MLHGMKLSFLSIAGKSCLTKQATVLFTDKWYLKPQFYTTESTKFITYHEWMSVGWKKTGSIPWAQATHRSIMRGSDDPMHVSVPTRHGCGRAHRMIPENVNCIIQSFQTIFNSALLLVNKWYKIWFSLKCICELHKENLSWHKPHFLNMFPIKFISLEE